MLINNFRKEKRNTSITKKDINIIREYSYNLMLIHVSVNVIENFLEHLNGKKWTHQTYSINMLIEIGKTKR